MKGIILAGGYGTRLYPSTHVISKHLIPLYDKPMVYYPLCTLMLSGIRRILLISTAQDIPRYEKLIGDGHRWGIDVYYAVQDEPRGLAEAFIIGRDFMGTDRCALILGDNVFYGHGLTDLLIQARQRTDGATIFAYAVSDPERYGVVEIDKRGKAIHLEEKPRAPRSHYAVTGLYFYDNQVATMAQDLVPSARGELEITDINKIYLQQDKLHVEIIGRGIAWLDTGTHDSILEAAHFIQTIEKRQNMKVSSPEEIAWRSGWITDPELERLVLNHKANSYGNYLRKLLMERCDEDN